MKPYLIAGGITAAAVALALPVLAQQPGNPPRPAMTRAAVEAKVQAQFFKLDADRDGAVTRAELAAPREVKRADRRAAAFDRLDADRNGRISRTEFAAPRAELRGDRDGRRHGKHIGKRGQRGMGGMGLARADADKDGRVTLAEAKAGAMARFAKADTNGDGKIGPDEHRGRWRR